MPNLTDFKTHEEYLMWWSSYRAKNREKLRTYNRIYNKEFRAKNGYKNEQKWKENNPQKVSAQRKAQRALKNAKIKKSNCELCTSLEVVMHHDDYNQPLKIRWFCKKHHRQIHYGELKHEESLQ